MLDFMDVRSILPRGPYPPLDMAPVACFPMWVSACRGRPIPPGKRRQRVSCKSLSEPAPAFGQSSKGGEHKRFTGQYIAIPSLEGYAKNVGGGSAVDEKRLLQLAKKTVDRVRGLTQMQGRIALDMQRDAQAEFR